MKSILITGCSSGIGHDAAHGLQRAGWRVFATCRAEADCERLRGEGLESFALDVDDSDSIAAAVAEVLARTGGTLDALYNNAAFACPGAVEDLPRGALREIFETNLFGLHELTTRVIPVMRAQGHGRIVNCSSVLGLVGIRWRGAYVATKFALEGLTDILRMEMADTADQGDPDRARPDRQPHPCQLDSAFRTLDQLARLAAPRAIRGKPAQAALRRRQARPLATAALGRHRKADARAGKPESAPALLCDHADLCLGHRAAVAVNPDARLDAGAR